jgi:hypothetical protein
MHDICVFKYFGGKLNPLDAYKIFFDPRHCGANIAPIIVILESALRYAVFAITVQS